MKQNEYTNITHSFPPFYSESSKLLILGSFPSVKSREDGFFYGHPQNRFWKMLAAVYGEALPTDITQKKVLLERHNIALYDVIYSCDIVGSSDSSIKNVVPANLNEIIENSHVERIILNGKNGGEILPEVSGQLAFRYGKRYALDKSCERGFFAPKAYRSMGRSASS